MDIPRKGVVPRGRFLVAMRPEATAAEARELGRVLGLKPELTRDVLGGSAPRVIAARSTQEEADALARVLTARGREAVAWDSTTPLVELFYAESLQLEEEQVVLELRGRAHRVFPLKGIQRIIDFRVRAEPWGGSARSVHMALPERALIFVPVPMAGGWNQPGVLSSRSVATGDSLRPEVTAAQLLQETALRLRSRLPDTLIEVRTTAASMGLESSDEDALLDRMIQLLARLPPPPAGGTPESTVS